MLSHLVPSRTRAPRRAGGFTLIETMVALVIASIVSMIAIPSFQGHLQRARRADAMVAMMQIQLAQSRWRANSDRYASLSEIGLPSASSAGHYSLRVSSDDPDGYAVTASAIGPQAADAACRVLKLSVLGAELLRSSGTDTAAANDAATNRRCWGL